VSGQSGSGSGSSALHRTSASAGSKAGSRSASGIKHGLTPVQRDSNGARAREFAATRGQGRHAGLVKTHSPSRNRTHHKTAKSRPVHVKRTPVAKGRTAPPKTQPNTPANTQSAPKNAAPKSHGPAQPAPEPAPATDHPAPRPNAGTGVGTGKSTGSTDKHLPGAANTG
jgi:hypothetical protein